MNCLISAIFKKPINYFINLKKYHFHIDFEFWNLKHKNWVFSLIITTNSWIKSHWFLTTTKKYLVMFFISWKLLNINGLFSSKASQISNWIWNLSNQKIVFIFKDQKIDGVFQRYYKFLQKFAFCNIMCLESL